MPRKPRLYMPDQPQHVVVRGHNRGSILIRQEDFRFLYTCVRDAANRYGLPVHAWVFMRNHLHLLATPSAADVLPKVMQSIGRRYAQYFNRTYRRSGALWEGRYKASLVDTDRYLLACYRYIELNPLRAGIVREPEEYPYSSYHANALGKPDSLVTPHPVYLALGMQGSESQSDSDPNLIPNLLDNYRALIDQVLTRKVVAEIRRGTQKGTGIGQAEFLAKVAKLCS